MKNLEVLILALFLSFSLNLSAKSVTTTTKELSCYTNIKFEQPRQNSFYNIGASVYVRVRPVGSTQVEFMELYVNGKFVRKVAKPPFVWGRKYYSDDSYLRHLKKGTYRLKVRVKDKCGHSKEIFRTFIVKGRSNNDNQRCNYDAWFSYPQNGKSLSPGSNINIKVDVQNKGNISHCELSINGKFVGNKRSYPFVWNYDQGRNRELLNNLKPGEYKLRCRVYNKCKEYRDIYSVFYVKGGTNGSCKYKSWFKYPKNNNTYKYGDDVYVRVDTEKYQDIKHMQLWVNGKFVRKEVSYPYDWCKGSNNSDGYLRNLKRGTYNITVRVTTKCGKWVDYFCKFYVR